jgi:nucleoside-diphosphate-sugar epimerase
VYASEIDSKSNEEGETMTVNQVTEFSLKSTNKFPPFDLTRFLQTVFKPKKGEKLCILIDLENPLDPKWYYPKSKVKTKNLMKAEHGNIPIVIMRIAGFYNDECHSIPIANQIQRIYEHQFTSHVYSGDTIHGAPFLHLDDLAEK